MTVRDQSLDARRFSGPPASAPTPIAVGEALRNNWLEIWYQPKIDLKRKCLAGAEALARIRHPQEGMLWPESFLPGVDEDSLIALTKHAVLTTLRNWTNFADAGFNLHLAINVPASALSKLPLTKLVAENRPRDETWPGLILEISEDQIVRDIDLAQGIAAELKASGVTIAIDDFGAGYSSFSSLRTVPFAELKVDDQFVKDRAADAARALPRIAAPAHEQTEARGSRDRRRRFDRRQGRRLTAVHRHFCYRPRRPPRETFLLPRRCRSADLTPRRQEMKKFVLAAAAGALALTVAVPAMAEVVVRDRGAVVIHHDRDWHRHHADCRVVKVKKRLPNGNVIVKTRRSC